MTKLVWGVLIGICLTLFVMYCNQIFLSPKPFEVNQEALNDSTHLNRFELSSVVVDLKISDKNIEEKINSLDKRLDDLLVFGGIIVTLVLAISLGVYVKAENEVEKHFRVNFEKHKVQITDTAQEVRELLNKIKADSQIAQSLRKRMQNNQTPD